MSQFIISKKGREKLAACQARDAFIVPPDIQSLWVSCQVPSGVLRLTLLANDFYAVVPVTRSEFYRLMPAKRPETQRESRAKWRKGDTPLNFGFFQLTDPTTIIWDNLSNRAQNIGFLWNWPYLSLRNAFGRKRFWTAERIDADD